MTGNVFKRVVAPASSSVFVFNNGKCYWADGSAATPIVLPNVEEEIAPAFAYIAGIDVSGNLSKTSASNYISGNGSLLQAVTLTAAQYAAIATPLSTTLYIVVG